MTRTTPPGRRRKTGHRESAAGGENDSNAATEVSTPYLPVANPPRKRPGLLLIAALLWLLCIAALAYLAYSGVYATAGLKCLRPSVATLA